MRFVIITGVSGAGKSLTIKYLEDMGYFCVDNLPPSLIPKFAEICVSPNGKIEKVALVIDVRGGDLLKDFIPGLKYLEENNIQYDVLFLEAADNTLIKRFKESRRNHPLSPDGRISLGIQMERDILKDIKNIAKNIIDTTNLGARELKEELYNILVEGKKFEGLVVSVISFGFKYGIPIDCDLVFDVRFIPNPYYIESMKKLSGNDEVVRDYVLNLKETKEFMEKTMSLLEFLIPNYVKEGKTQLIIGVGCTGGRHRSVAIGNAINGILSDKHRSVIEHRDIFKDNKR
jgi:RNase adapter protein RapZ